MRPNFVKERETSKEAFETAAAAAVEGDESPNGNIGSRENNGNAIGGKAKGGRALSSSARNRVREGLEPEVTIGVCRHICLKGGSCRCRERNIDRPTFLIGTKKVRLRLSFINSGLNTFSHHRVEYIGPPRPGATSGSCFSPDFGASCRSFTITSH